MILVCGLVSALLPLTVHAQSDWEYVGPDFALLSAVHLDGGDVIYTGGLYPGALRSVDDGQTWDYLDYPGWEPHSFGHSELGTIFAATFGSGREVQTRRLTLLR